jgi:hypothetical protein
MSESEAFSEHGTETESTFKLLPLDPRAEGKVVKSIKAKTDLRKAPVAIPLDQEDRFARLESLILAQHDRTERLQELIYTSLSIHPNIEQHHEDEFSDVESDEDDETATVNVKSPVMRAAQPPPNPEAGPSQPAKRQPKGFAGKMVDKTTSGPIDDDLAESLDFLLKNDVSRERLEEIANTYKAPANCEALRPPSCNESIYKKLKKHAKTTEKRMQAIQKYLLVGMTALSKVAPKELTEEWEHGFTALAAASYRINGFRKSQMKMGINPEFASLCESSGVPITDNLFGDDLPKHVRDLAEMNKITKQLMKDNGRFAPYKLQQSPSHNRNQQRRPQPPFLTGIAPPRPPKLHSQNQNKGRNNNSGNRNRNHPHNRQ